MPTQQHTKLSLFHFTATIEYIALPMYYVTYVSVVRHVKPVHILYQATYRRGLGSIEYIVVDLVSYLV